MGISLKKISIALKKKSLAPKITAALEQLTNQPTYKWKEEERLISCFQTGHFIYELKMTYQLIVQAHYKISIYNLFLDLTAYICRDSILILGHTPVTL